MGYVDSAITGRGITGGCGGGNFCPGDPVSRAQMATFVVRTLGEPASHEVGTPGEPGFGCCDIVACQWSNFETSVHSTAGFIRDGATAVRTIFVLPQGFCPERRSVFTVLTNGQLGRVTVKACSDGLIPGGVHVEVPATFANADQWVSLDGISFRYDPEQPGCS